MAEMTMTQEQYQQWCDENKPFEPGPQGKSRGIAALLGIFIGWSGAQFFYLGKSKAGIICLAISAVTCGVWCLIPFISGIMMFLKDNKTFEEKYITTEKTFPLF